MIDALRGWIIKIIGASVLSAIALSVTLSPKMKRVVSLCCSFLAAAVLLSPLSGLSEASVSLEGSRERASFAAGELEQKNEELRRGIIAERCRAYILSKAAELGVEAEASVTLSGDGTPYSCRVSVECGGAVKFVLSETITRDLGIPEDRQYWG
jgi:hypothetical protein